MLAIADKKEYYNFARESAGVAQLVEHNLAKVRVAGSSPVSRSNKKSCESSCFIFTSADAGLPGGGMSENKTDHEVVFLFDDTSQPGPSSLRRDNPVSRSNKKSRVSGYFIIWTGRLRFYLKEDRTNKKTRMYQKAPPPTSNMMVR